MNLEAMEEMSLEEGFEALDKIINKLDNDEGSLENAFRDYEAGMKLLAACRSKLDMVEKKVKALSEDGEVYDFEEGE